ncbi:histidinol-phosphate transaminase [Cerasicoccus arenae]|uniref:Histidinol-phosphate aminotransferase n=1 Tax=Cerasicoccus arenae TaxID=424488 RepID=A0A8J3GD36_9BACT|nr:histidinol-phosphate transaminase [Cerasicoccus arenae]MBK1859327.1 histidinol-phosphate transaminase [Cerasicoccus arenae]GHB93916.1 histidinol-phosphate aminotransferase [Cerasicoccus arenae]
MNYSELVRPDVLNQPIYEPGKPIEYVAREYGLEAASILKLASNENPLGPSPLGLEAAQRALREAHLYPDGGCTRLREALAQKFELAANQFIITNGSNEFMTLLCQAFCGPGDEAVMGAQSFIAFKIGVLLAGAKPVEVPMPDMRHDLDALADAVTERTKLVYLPCPNNPTGDCHSLAAIEALIDRLPDHVIFCFDEAYAEYSDDAPDLRPLIAAGKKVVCCRTFSKIYGLAAFRIGYGYGAPELMALLNRVRAPFNVNAIAQAAAIAALSDHEHVARAKAVNHAGMHQLTQGFEALGLEYRAEGGNFVLLKVENPAQMFDSFQQQGIIVRPLKPYLLAQYIRVTIGTETQNTRLLKCLEATLHEGMSNSPPDERPSK